MNYKTYSEIKAALKGAFKKGLSQLKKNKTVFSQSTISTASTLPTPTTQDSINPVLNLEHKGGVLTISNFDFKDFDLTAFIEQFPDCKFLKIVQCNNVNTEDIAKLSYEYAVINSDGLYQGSKFYGGIISYIKGEFTFSKVKLR